MCKHLEQELTMILNHLFSMFVSTLRDEAANLE